MSGPGQWWKRLPSSWQLKPLKAVASYVVSNVDKVPADDESPVRLCNYTDVYNNEFINSSIELMRSTATADEIVKFQLRQDDVVITKDSEAWDDIGIPALVTAATDDLVCGYHLAILRPIRKVVRGRFLFRCLQAKAIRVQLEVAATGITRFGLSKDDIGRLLIPVPPLSHQERITTYLDIETERIDSLIAAKEAMLSLAAEKRTALVSRLVTKGVGPRARLKPSGLEWLGEIPQEWDIMRLKHFAQIGNGSTPDRENAEYWEGGSYPWLNSSVVNDRPVQSASRYVTQAALSECHLPQVEAPALLVAITGEGKTRGKTTVLEFEATINQHLAFVKPKPPVADCFYLSYLLDTAYGFLRSESDSAGSTRGAITCEELGNFRVPLPPLGEQRTIVHAISEREAQFRRLQQDLQRSIDLLSGRRQALITAAVTGRLEREEMPR